MECKNQKDHCQHICQLKVAQQFDKVRELKKRAQYFCKICEEQSFSPENLCDPQEYKGKAGVLKWR